MLYVSRSHPPAWARSGLEKRRYVIRRSIFCESVAMRYPWVIPRLSLKFSVARFSHSPISKATKPLVALNFVAGDQLINQWVVWLFGWGNKTTNRKAQTANRALFPVPGSENKLTAIQTIMKCLIQYVLMTSLSCDVTSNAGNAESTGGYHI